MPPRAQLQVLVPDDVPHFDATGTVLLRALQYGGTKKVPVERTPLVDAILRYLDQQH